MVAEVIHVCTSIKEHDPRARDVLNKIDSNLNSDTVDNMAASTQQDISQMRLESEQFVEAMRRFVQRHDKGMTLQQKQEQKSKQGRIEQ